MMWGWGWWCEDAGKSARNMPVLLSLLLDGTWHLERSVRRICLWQPQIRVAQRTGRDWDRKGLLFIQMSLLRGECLSVFFPPLSITWNLLTIWKHISQCFILVSPLSGSELEILWSGANDPKPFDLVFCEGSDWRAAVILFEGMSKEMRYTSKEIKKYLYRISSFVLF